ncbi:MAG: SBBP repeat-containing protein [Candidatus Helarchaeota archaeon]
MRSINIKKAYNRILFIKNKEFLKIISFMFILLLSGQLFIAFGYSTIEKIFKFRLNDNNFIQTRNSSQNYIEQWTLVWGGTGIEWAPGLSIDAIGNLYLAGFTGSYGTGECDVYLLKISSAGIIIWNITWGGIKNEYCYGTVQNNNYIYVAAMTESFGNGYFDAALIKYNMDGNLIWNITWGGIENDYGLDVAVDSHGDIYMTGYTRSIGAGDFDMFLVKYNSSGFKIWERTWGGNLTDYCYGIIIDNNDNIYTAGWTESFGAGKRDAFVVKYNSTGHQIWNRTFGGPENDLGWSVATDSFNNVYFTGPTESFGYGLRDAFIVKYNASGDIIWNKTWGGTNDDSGYDVTIDNNDNVIFIGSTESFGAGMEDAFIAKYDPQGMLLWNTTYGTSINDDGCDVIADSLGNLYLSGRTNSTGNWNAFLVKYGLFTNTTQTIPINYTTGFLLFIFEIIIISVFIFFKKKHNPFIKCQL